MSWDGSESLSGMEVNICNMVSQPRNQPVTALAQITTGLAAVEPGNANPEQITAMVQSVFERIPNELKEEALRVIAERLAGFRAKRHEYGKAAREGKLPRHIDLFGDEVENQTAGFLLVIKTLLELEGKEPGADEQLQLAVYMRVLLSSRRAMATLRRC